jgi:methylthioribose-1-phosphate isomerase
VVPERVRQSVALSWDGRSLRLLDQTLLPAEERWIEPRDAAGTAAAIRTLSVRGAPLIGIAAAYGMAMEIAADPTPQGVERAWRTLRTARPTAVNLGHAVDRVRDAALTAAPDDIAAAARSEAEAVHAEEDAASAAIAVAGADLLEGARRALTLCNTGALAAGGSGSALAVLLELHGREPDLEVLVCETRPLLQGARLTVWELARAGVRHSLIVDSAAAGLLARREADAVIVGCDRVAANGDVANKVGTYGLALAAREAGVPFVVAGPASTLDPSVASGDQIAIEERGADEVRTVGGTALTLAGTSVRNPAFDVTPAALVSALVTERGVVHAPSAATLASLLGDGRRSEGGAGVSRSSQGSEDRLR